MVVSQIHQFNEFLSEFADFPIPIRAVLGNDAGIGKARDVGVQSTNTDILSFVDDDDLVKVDFFERLLYSLVKNPGMSAVGAWLQSFGYATHQLPQFDNLPVIGVINCLPSAGILMWRKSEITHIGGFDHSFRNGYEDFSLTSRGALEKLQIRVIDEPLYLYRRHKSSTSSQYTRELETNYRHKIIERALDHGGEDLSDIMRLLYVNPNSLKDESPFYWAPRKKDAKKKRTSILLWLYHQLPYGLRRRIYELIYNL
jgi:glycosyltransferase involved in cell wall biosynthesis